ncbi:HDIG domain-containing protein [Prolixibacteraceae bacterium JC049]|nr:HDIG domain-containing protein [Prolixibacteraceae bacterium JC049]
MNPYHIIEKYYTKGSELYQTLVIHSENVARKAKEIAQNNSHLEIDLTFLNEAALLHDIGIFLTHAPSIHCHGENPYIAHGYLGRQLLEQEGYPEHAKVCERHTGCGLSVQTIQDQELPIPHRDMLPVSMEEQLICFADKFFSKSNQLDKEKSIEKIRKSMAKHGNEQVMQFDAWCKLFNI